jgi:hypothetical protein
VIIAVGITTASAPTKSQPCFHSGGTSPPPSHSPPLQSPAKSKSGVFKSSTPLGQEASVSLKPRYSGVEDDNDYHHHASHATQSSLPPRISEHSFKGVSEWAPSPEQPSGGRAVVRPSRVAPLRGAVGGAAAVKGGSGKDRATGSSVTVPDLPPRLGVERVRKGGAGTVAAGRIEGGGGGRLAVSNIQFGGDAEERVYASHAGGWSTQAKVGEV